MSWWRRAIYWYIAAFLTFLAGALVVSVPYVVLAWLGASDEVLGVVAVAGLFVFGVPALGYVVDWMQDDVDYVDSDVWAERNPHLAEPGVRRHWP